MVLVHLEFQEELEQSQGRPSLTNITCGSLMEKKNFNMFIKKTL